MKANKNQAYFIVKKAIHLKIPNSEVHNIQLFPCHHFMYYHEYTCVKVPATCYNITLPALPVIK